MNLFNRTLIACLLVAFCWSLTPQRLTTKIYKERIKKQLGNTHFFVVTSKHVEIQKIASYLSEFEHEHKIQLYECRPTENKDICPLDVSIMLIINTIRIDFNGRSEHEEDYFKWIKFRVSEMPHRLHSIDELRLHAQDKNQVFCFIDREGHEVTKKQYIFVATAKRFHFLYFCNLDVSIARQLGMKEGHLVLVRKDLSFNVDFWSEKLSEDNEELHRVWVNFLISSYESQFRIESRNKSHDLVTVQCDLSLECQQELIELLDAELKWREKHPQINFKIKFLPGTSGELNWKKKVKYDLPIIKFGKTTVRKRIYHQESGAVVEETDYERDTYMKTDPVIDQDTIERLLKDYEEKKLISVVRDIQTDIRSLDGEEGEYHREMKRKQEQAQL